MVCVISCYGFIFYSLFSCAYFPCYHFESVVLFPVEDKFISSCVSSCFTLPVSVLFPPW